MDSTESKEEEISRKAWNTIYKRGREVPAADPESKFDHPHDCIRSDREESRVSARLTDEEFEGYLMDLIPPPLLSYDPREILRANRAAILESADYWHMLADEQMNKALDAEARERDLLAALEALSRRYHREAEHEQTSNWRIKSWETCDRTTCTEARAAIASAHRQVTITTVSGNGA